MDANGKRAMMNPLHLIDFYKADHRRQYPDGTTLVVSNWTPRQSRVEGVDHIVWFGLQYLLAHYFGERFNYDFFWQNRRRVLDEYKRRMDLGLGQGAIDVEHIAALHRYGRMPLTVRALPEGTLVPLRVPCMTIQNSHPDFFWMTNYVETLLSSVLWGMCTSATTAHRYRMILERWQRTTGGPAAFVPWQAHDFSMRGMMGPEAAAMSGAGHLLSFTGTDTVPALDLLEQYYGGEEEAILGGSVPATEHSVMCMGQEAGELETFSRLLDLYPKGVVSIVSDTWDLWRVLQEYLPQLKERILARNGKVVIRPDSGDPVDILCGRLAFIPKQWRSPEHHIHVPEDAADKGVVELLWDIFGGTVNAAGFKELDPHIGAIYGDSITPDRAGDICWRLAAKGFATTNVVLGVGSYTYQYVTRDTFGFAVKATYGEVNHEGRAIYKKPVTDNGVKNSAKGLVAVVRDGAGRLQLVDGLDHGYPGDLLETVYYDGKLLRSDTITAIRRRLAEQREELLNRLNQ